MAFLKIRRILPGAAALILVCGISVSGDPGRDKLNALLGRMGEISSLRANVTINNEISGTLSFKNRTIYTSNSQTVESFLPTEDSFGFILRQELLSENKTFAELPEGFLACSAVTKKSPKSEDRFD